MLLLTLMDNTRVGFFVQIFIWRVIIAGKVGKWWYKVFRCSLFRHKDW